MPGTSCTGLAVLAVCSVQLAQTNLWHLAQVMLLLLPNAVGTSVAMQNGMSHARSRGPSPSSSSSVMGTWTTLTRACCIFVPRSLEYTMHSTSIPFNGDFGENKRCVHNAVTSAGGVRTFTSKNTLFSPVRLPLESLFVRTDFRPNRFFLFESFFENTGVRSVNDQKWHGMN